MRYFKLIKDDTIFGVISNESFRRYQNKYNRIIFTDDIDNAELIKYKDIYYWDNWLNPYPSQLTNKIQIFSIKIEEIDEEQFNILKKALQTEERIVVQQQVIQPQIQLQPELSQEDPDETLEYIKKIKIMELKQDNQKKLKKDFIITLENGKTYHFSFNNMGLFNLITTMNTQQESQENISFILQKMNEFKQQCDSYCNSLIQQVQSSKDIKEINDIHYEKEGDN